LKTPVADATAQVGRRRLEVEKVLGVITSVRGEINVTTRNGSSGWQWFATGGLLLTVRQTLTGKHKTYNSC
jgi:hypothetical protein